MPHMLRALREPQDFVDSLDEREMPLSRASYERMRA